MPGYIDHVQSGKLELMLFREGSELADTLLTDKKKAKASLVMVEVGPTEASLKPSADPISATVISCEKAGDGLYKLVLQTSAETSKLQVTKVARVGVSK